MVKDAPQDLDADVKLTVSIPRSLFDEVSALLEKRGVAVDVFVRMGLRNVVRKSMFHFFDTPLAFGKYRGETLGDVIKVDPGYILWALKNMDRFEIDDDSAALLNSIVATEGLPSADSGPTKRKPKLRVVDQK